MTKIYFSHDLDDPRVDVVRKHWLAQPGHEEAGFFDALTWADATMAGPSTIRRLLSSALDNTSVTCVLIGPQTSSRRWVRYEIVESMERRNRLLGIHINGIPDKSRQPGPAGPSPFEQLAIAISEDGSSVKILQYAHNAWLPYDDKPGWPLAHPAPPHRRGKRIQLSTLYRVYDWITDNGAHNFEKWVGG
ncbi:MAG TPA: TIR domain-containing protein [Burkholderiales bacterium]|nr:TIR domain-containing protein [Burkholderiales bacterium]